jgi:phospholipid/cholesterol/gamma-HCH transport system permease protein
LPKIFPFSSFNMKAQIKFSSQAEIDTCICSGNWTIDSIHQVERLLEKMSINQSQIIFDGKDIVMMDTAGAWLLFRSKRQLEKAGYSVVMQNFNTKHQLLLEIMANNISNNQDISKAPNFLIQLGQKTHEFFIKIFEFLAFVGETFVILFLSPFKIRWQALVANLYSAGVTALVIIGLMAFLMGVVLAYQGGSQLKLYGANIFIVDLVGVTLLRELAPLLTAILIAGRSGSAYTAEIGNMRVSEEIDALKTMGISPMELLVLPKLLALMIAMPLLTVFADIMGVLGGMLIAHLSFDVNISDFLEIFPERVAVSNYIIGIAKAIIFGIIISLVACYHGFQVKSSADSVGKHVTMSVVQAIFLVILVDAIFAILLSVLAI